MRVEILFDNILALREASLEVPLVERNDGLSTTKRSRLRHSVWKLTDFIEVQLPRFREEGKPSLTVAVGCTGGRHRSITVARALTNRLVEKGQNARLICRDLGKAGEYV